MQIFQRFLSKQILRPAAKGQGLAFLIFFLLSTLLMAATLRIMTNSAQPQSLHAYQDRFIANTIFTTAFETVREDILSKLNSGTTVDTTYTYPSPVNPPANATTPHDPTALNGTQDTIGTWSATMLYARGNTYTVQVTVSAGGANVSQTQLMQLIGQPSFNCNTVTSAIQAGNISTVSNANLTSYATNNCMLITATPPVAPTTNDGATACNTNHAGSGILQLANGITCGEVANGTYTDLYLHSGSSIGNGGSLTSNSASARNVNIPGTVANGRNITLSGAGAQTVLFADGSTLMANDATNAGLITGGTGDDVFRLNGTYESFGDTNDGSGTTTTWDAGAGNNQIYIKKVYVYSNNDGLSATGTVTTASSSGSNQIYFDNLTAQGTWSSWIVSLAVNGGTGNDIISCNGVFGTSPACTVTMPLIGPSWTVSLAIDGKAGNNIISLNTILTISADSNTSGNGNITVTGGTNTSYNIIYLQGCSVTNNGSASAAVTIKPGGSGKNLVIVKTLTGCTFSGQTGSDVLLYHTGTPPGSFGRTITY